MTRVLVTGARAPVALHLARVLGRAGCPVVLADTLANPLASASAACSRYVRLPPPDRKPDEFARALRQLIQQAGIDLVVPTCEEVFYLAWARETHGLGAATLVAPPLADLSRAHNKAHFAEDARRFGLHPPETTTVASPGDLAAVRSRAYQLVFKPVWSRFASAVILQPSEEQLNHLAPTAAQPWVAQEMIPGEELCCYAVALSGTVLALASYRPLHRAGNGAGIYFEPVAEPDIARQCAAYVAATGWTGQISFDFRRDEAGRLRVLECNPRATSGIHFFGPRSGLAATLLDGRPALPDITRPLMVPAAMLVYGLPTALRSGRVGDWRRDRKRAADALAWPGDVLPRTAQPRALLELSAIAVRRRISLIEASTDGIAWNGTPIGRPSTATNTGPM